MIRFFRKLFKRGDFMTRADKAYYKYRAKTIFWSAFCLIIISWVGTNLVLCALTTNVESNFDISYPALEHITLPKGETLNGKIKKSSYSTADTKIATITFDLYNADGGYLVDEVDVTKTATAEALIDDVNIYRLNSGKDVYVLSNKLMDANEDSSRTFYNLRGLQSINLTNYHVTSAVKNISYMFYYHAKLTELDLTGWDVSGVTNMSYAFHGYGVSTSRNDSSLSKLDITGWNTQNVTDFSFMFENCDCIPVGVEDLNVAKVENMEYMFRHVEGTSKQYLDLSHWNTSSVKKMYAMFASCNMISILNLDGWDTQNVTNMGSMFSGCSVTDIIGLSNFNTTNVEDMGSMFSSCHNLTKIDLSNFNTANVTTMSAMFFSSNKLTELDLSSFDTSQVVHFHQMFGDCTNLKTIYVSEKFSTKNADRTDSPFYGASRLCGGAGTVYDKNNVGMTYARIDGGPSSSTPGYFTYKPYSGK